jgi:hypothetical protein
MFNSSVYEITRDELYKEYDFAKKLTEFRFDYEKLTYDLTVVVNILTVNGNYFSFAHILLQEYLSALFISNLDHTVKATFYPKILSGNESFLSSSFLTFLYELDSRALIEFYLISALEQIVNSTANTPTADVLLEFVRLNLYKDTLLEPVSVTNVEVGQILNKLKAELHANKDFLEELLDKI